MNRSENSTPLYGSEVAIIGMAGRFPGARNLDEFWRNLRDGVESISFFSDEQLGALGVDPTAFRAPHFVKAAPVLENVDLFDAPLFGYSPREAEVLDPQHRLFLECAWEALENAGYNSDTFPGPIGVFGSSSLSTYLLFNLMTHPELTGAENMFQVMVCNDKNFLSTRVAYHLNLRGPSLDVQTACSSSLVAVHLACESLLSYQCDMALAGGVSVQMPQRTGYYYLEGEIASPDGHCRAFDAKAQGTVFGSGVGVVVLKRLEQALQDGDCIRAVIKGSAINNDGSLKVGYTAPSVDGQAEVIVRAQALADVAPETVSYIEAHGTGTALGDPVEVAALSKAFQVGTQKTRFCAIGSVKTNIGHLDAAAGVAGLIKTVLSLKHRMIPPTLHFETPNPRIDFENSPFYVNAALSEWKADRAPRRAGVSSLGIGGTNAHVVLEEAPAAPLVADSRPWHLLLLSAKTGSALEAATANLATHLKRHPDLNLADVAFTLQVGRRVLRHRRAIVCHSASDAVTGLETLDRKRVVTDTQESRERPVAFMFTGQGAQYVDMGRELYETEPVFREQVDWCAELARPHLELDLRTVLYPDQALAQAAGQQLDQTWLTQPALFVTEYALARLWMEWGVRPQAMIGHSIGEYVAACLAGVFSLENAVELVCARGRLMQQLPGGAMTAVLLPEEEVRPLLGEALSLAAVNGQSICVVSGPTDAIENLERHLTRQETSYRRLRTSHAFHSAMMDPILSPFTELVRRVKLSQPHIPYVSNLTGTWVTPAEATDPDYWAKHLRQTVRFADGVQQLLQEPQQVLLEVGPGRTLSTLVVQHSARTPGHVVLSSLRHPQDPQPDTAFLLFALGRLWAAGVQVDWPGFHARRQRHRIPLPTYPFEHQRYWIEPRKQAHDAGHRAASGKKPDISDWFYVPSWKRTALPVPLKAGKLAKERRRWLIFVDEFGLGAQLARRLAQENQDVVTVCMGTQFARSDEGTYTINPQQCGDYAALLKELALDKAPGEIVHLWSITSNDRVQPGAEFFGQSQGSGFHSLLFLAQALGKQPHDGLLHLWVISDHVLKVESPDVAHPEKATLLAPCKVIPQEYENVHCQYIDVVVPEAGARREAELINQIMGEISSKSADPVVAYRGRQRWVQTFEPVQLDAHTETIRPLRENGVYLITGGLGGIGLLLAEHLARTVHARLVLIGRSAYPAKEEWAQWLSTHDEHSEPSRTIRKLQALEGLGAQVLPISADVANEEQMQTALALAYRQFGQIHGVIHLAGIGGAKTVKFIPEVDLAECESQFRAKAYGLYVLARVLEGQELDFCLLFSSNASILGGLGSTAYTAANLFMDAFVLDRAGDSSIPWISVNWDGWRLDKPDRPNTSFQTSLDQYTMTPQEGLEAFRRVLSMMTAAEVVVSTGDLPSRLDLWIRRQSQVTGPKPSDSPPVLHPRPELEIAYAPPSDELEEKIVRIWQEFLGVDQLGIRDNFFDLGGNSLMALKVVSRLKQDLGVEVPVVSLFEGPTVQALAQVIGQRDKGQDAYEQSLSRGERRRERHRRKDQMATGT